MLYQNPLFSLMTLMQYSSKNFDDLCTRANTSLCYMSKQFKANKFALKLNETNTIKFRTHNSPQYMLSNRCDEDYTGRVIKYKIPWFTN